MTFRAPAVERRAALRPAPLSCEERTRTRSDRLLTTLLCSLLATVPLALASSGCDSDMTSTDTGGGGGEGSGSGGPGGSGTGASTGAAGEGGTTQPTGTAGEGGGNTTSSTTSTGTTTGPMAPGGYSVSGNTILDANGDKHLFHGIARPSTE
ncbi:MAG: hypothetical protein R3B70_47515 [Polyangiaceae bacterium]